MKTFLPLKRMAFAICCLLLPNLLYAETEPNNTYTQANPLVSGTPMTGNLDANDKEDWYKITLTGNSTAEFSITANGDLTINYLTLYFESAGKVEQRNSKALYAKTGTLSVTDMAAGTYYFKVDRYNGANSYTLNYKLTPNATKNDTEPNNSYDKAITLTSGQQATGHLGYYYKAEADRDIEDWYKITLNENSSVEFSIETKEDLTINYLTLYCEDGGIITQRNAKALYAKTGTLSITDMAAGTYYLKVDRYSYHGSYTLDYTLTQNPVKNDAEPNNSYDKALTLSSGKQVTGHLGYYYKTDTDRDKEDWYKIITTDNSTVEFSIETKEDLTINYLTLYCEDGGIITQRDAKALYAKTGTLSVIDMAAGTYYLKVDRYSYHGSYTLDYTNSPNALANDKEPNNSYTTALPIADKQTVTGHLGYYYKGNADRDNEDWYKITLDNNSAVEFNIEAQEGLTINYLTLYYENAGKAEHRNYKALYAKTGTLSITDMAAGNYYLKVDRYGGQGNYSLSYTLSPNATKNDTEPNNSYDKAITLTSGQQATGHLGYYYKAEADRDIEDWYKIILNENSSVEFSILAKESLTINYLTLYYEGEGKAEHRNSKALYAKTGTLSITDMAAGTYYLKVDQYGNHGSYTLEYTLTPNPLKNDTEPNNSYDKALTLSPGKQVTGHLGYYYKTDTDRDKEDWYKITATDNSAVEFSIVAKEDLTINYLTLYYEKEGKTVQRNAKALYAKIGKLTVTDLTSGTFYLKVDRYSGHGSYTLSYNMKTYTVGFDLVKVNNTVKIFNKSNGDAFDWDFGDGTSSKDKFPEHTYTKAGDFVITQKVMAEGSSTFWTAKQTVSIYGIDRFSPNKAGSGGDMVMTIYGGGLDKSAQVKLSKGSTVITPIEIRKPKLGMVDAIFDLHVVPAGVYDLTVTVPGQTPVVFSGGVTIEGFKYPHVVSSIEGYSTLRTGRTWNYSLCLQNTGNVMAKGVNAYIAVPDLLEFGSALKPLSATPGAIKDLSFYDEELKRTFVITKERIKETMDILRTDYIHVDALFGQPFKGKIYHIYVPMIAGNASIKVPFTVKSLSTQASDQSQIQSFVLPINDFGSCASPMTTEMQNKMVDVFVANLDKLPFVDKNPPLKIFVKAVNIGKSALRNAASYFGYLWEGMSSDEAFHEAYISEGQLDKSNAEVITGLVDCAMDMGLDKLKGYTSKKMTQYRDDRNYYLQKMFQEKTTGDKFGVQLFNGFTKDNEARFNKLSKLRDFLGGIEDLKSANGMMGDAKDLLEAYAKDCPELRAMLADFYGFADDYSGFDNLKSKHLNIGTSVDPNEIVGPHGFGTEKYITGNETANYLIRFENKESAPLAAQIVNIYDTLDVSKYDLKTFNLSDVTIGDAVITFPPSRSEYFTQYDMRPAIDLIVSISAKLDTTTGIAHWQFLSLDPKTKDLTNNPELGFLPPNKKPPIGEGSVSFTIKMKSKLADKAKINNRASIIFDFNEQILTNRWINTIDKEAPTGRATLITQNNDSIFTVNWTSSDTGSKVRYVELYGAVGNADFVKMGSFTGNKASFFGKPGTTVHFYAVPVDSVGNRPVKLKSAEVSLLLTGDKPITQNAQGLSVYPNPAHDILNIRTKDAPISGDCVVEMTAMDGKQYRIGVYLGQQLNDGIQIPVNNLTRGLYLLRILYGDKSVSQKISID